MINQVINEIFRQMTITLTLPLDVPVRPMDAKGLIKQENNCGFLFKYHSRFKVGGSRNKMGSWYSEGYN